MIQIQFVKTTSDTSIGNQHHISIKHARYLSVGSTDTTTNPHMTRSLKQLGS